MSFILVPKYLFHALYEFELQTVFVCLYYSLTYSSKVYDIRRIAIQIEVYDLDLIFCVDLVDPLLWTIPGDWRYLVTQCVWLCYFFEWITDCVEIKGSKSVTLLSTEAECVAISEAVRKLKFIYQVMRSLEIEVKLPIRVNVDNVGAIFLAKNKIASEKTKRVDARHHYVRELMNVL